MDGEGWIATLLVPLVLLGLATCAENALAQGVDVSASLAQEYADSGAANLDRLADLLRAAEYYRQLRAVGIDDQPTIGETLTRADMYARAALVFAGAACGRNMTGSTPDEAIDFSLELVEILSVVPAHSAVQQHAADLAAERRLPVGQETTKYTAPVMQAAIDLRTGGQMVVRRCGGR